ncbi:hypothetical protein AGMMS4956_15560 [Bacteroidia bacterium]|nr:hypothetical protein AGMMS4956_15560 [Bacteroidia bacterium]
MENTDIHPSSFNLLKYKIVRSDFKINDNYTQSAPFDAKFDPSGVFNTKECQFELTLRVIITDSKENFYVDVTAKATFGINKKESKESLDKFFYINAPSIIFPYVRAYISALMTLSENPFIIPTFNLVALGQHLKDNTKEI